MTLIAGVFSIDEGRKIPDTLKLALSKAISRDTGAGLSLQTLSSPRCFAVKLDIGVYEEPALIQEPGGSFSALMGDPLICEGDVRQPRPVQVDALQQACDAGDDIVFNRARGTFSFVRFNASRGTLTLVSDAIGVRPLYYSLQDGFLVFGSALRMLESLEFVKKTICLIGLAEQVAFGYSLAERTPYEEILLLRESQVLTCDASGIRARGYFDWSQPTARYRSYAEGVIALADCFKDAVRLRAGTDERAHAFLSGGLDSRSIVGTLIDQGIHIDAVNFSFPGTQDEAYAKAFVANVGGACSIRYIPLNEAMLPAHWSQLMANAISDAPHQPGRPGLVWSGDGGSVGLGHVYMDARVVQLLNQNQVSAAIEHFLGSNKIDLPLFVFKASASRRLANSFSHSVSEEMDRYSHSDAGRRLYLFLLLNSNRRHLHRHFEDIDMHKLEFHLPFYDAAFMKRVCTFPGDAGIEHRLYMDWLELLPAIIRQSPWQTYPGHVPCPIALPDDYDYQWRVEPPTLVARGQSVNTAVALLRSTLTTDFPDQFISRIRTAILAALYCVRLQNCEYVTRVVDEFAAYPHPSAGVT